MAIAGAFAFHKHIVLIQTLLEAIIEDKKQLQPSVGTVMRCSCNDTRQQGSTIIISAELHIFDIRQDFVGILYFHNISILIIISIWKQFGNGVINLLYCCCWSFFSTISPILKIGSFLIF